MATTPRSCLSTCWARPWSGHATQYRIDVRIGSRAGFWTCGGLFATANLPATVFGVATALKRIPMVAAMKERAGTSPSTAEWVEHRNMAIR